MKNKKFGIALGSGAWMGLAHVGVLKSLEENNISPSFIAGSSAGSIFGGLYAFTGSVKEVEKIITSLSFKTIIKPILNRSLNKSFDVDVKFDRLLKSIVGDIKIEDLKIPYSAVASDLLTGEPVVIKSGNLVTAMKASSAVPLLFRPVKIDDSYLVDGGMTYPIPIDVVRSMGADIVMGVNLYSGIFPINLKIKKISRSKSFKMSRYLWLKKLADINQQSADIVLNLDIKNTDFGVFAKFFNNQETINIGYLSTNKIIDQIKKRLNSLNNN
jgi:NTE family protein